MQINCSKHLQTEIPGLNLHNNINFNASKRKIFKKVTRKKNPVSYWWLPLWPCWPTTREQGERSRCRDTKQINVESSSSHGYSNSE